MTTAMEAAVVLGVGAHPTVGKRCRSLVVGDSWRNISITREDGSSAFYSKNCHECSERCRGRKGCALPLRCTILRGYLRGNGGEDEAKTLARQLGPAWSRLAA
uniref:Uncharacterized protein n=1 Tax=Oryza barthii TaxID=65489 RepID=A0A0D3HUP4_9ORYZ